MIEALGTVVIEKDAVLITGFVFNGEGDTDPQAAELAALHWAASKIQAAIEEAQAKVRKM